MASAGFPALGTAYERHNHKKKGGISNQTKIEHTRPRSRSESQAYTRTDPSSITLLFLPTSEEVSTFKFFIMLSRATNRTKSRDPPPYTIHPANNKKKKQQHNERTIHYSNRTTDPINPSDPHYNEGTRAVQIQTILRDLSFSHLLRQYTNFQTQSWSRSKITNEKTTTIKRRCWTCLTYDTRICLPTITKPTHRTNKRISQT